MVPYHILLVEDHSLVRQGIMRIIEDMPEVKVVAETGDGMEVVNIITEIAIQMVIMDITLPGVSGIEITRKIKSAHPATKVLILTMHNNREFLKLAISMGADGYLLKHDAPKELLTAIATIRDGKNYISPLLSAQLTDFYIRSHKEVPYKSWSGTLSAREVEIVKLIAEGKSSREIADLLYISFRTVQNHRINIMRKLNLKKNTDLVKYAISQGYISPNP